MRGKRQKAEALLDTMQLQRALTAAAEQIVTTLRQIEVLQAHGKTINLACKEAGTTEQSYYRWCNEYGMLGVDQAIRLKQLETNNARLKKLVADLSLEKKVLQEIDAGRRWTRLVKIKH